MACVICTQYCWRKSPLGKEMTFWHTHTKKWLFSQTCWDMQASPFTMVFNYVLFKLQFICSFISMLLSELPHRYNKRFQIIIQQRHCPVWIGSIVFHWLKFFLNVSESFLWPSPTYKHAHITCTGHGNKLYNGLHVNCQFVTDIWRVQSGYVELRTIMLLQPRTTCTSSRTVNIQAFYWNVSI